MKRILLVLAIANFAWVYIFADGANAGTGFAPARLHAGMQTPGVTVLQKYLRTNQHGNYFAFGGYTGFFGVATQSGLKQWQTADGFPATGWITIGSSQWNRLRHEALALNLPVYIDPQSIGAAVQAGWAIDASKSPSVVNVLRYNPATRKVTVVLSISAAYAGVIGGTQYVTDDGVFHIYLKEGPDFVSRLYNNAPMPWAACFNGGQCLHYDGLFPSHGCIHIPSMTAAKYIHDLPMGTTVVVHE